MFVCALAVLIARHLRGPSTLEDPDARPRRAVTIVSAAIFLIYLTPVLHILDIGAVLAERFLLAPSLGFVLLLVLLGAEVLERLVSNARRRRTAAALGLAGLAVLGGWRSMERATEWRDNVRLWAATAAAVPGDARVHLNLGAAYFERGELEAAQGEFERSLELEPRNTMALGNLGALQLRRGEYAGALATYERMVGHDSANFIAWHNLGLAEAHLLRHSVAVGHYSRCLEINPNYVPAHTNLRESQRIIAKASRFIETNRADAETSPDPRLLEEMVNACTVVGDAPCAERFAAMAAKRGGAE
jgi:tetratricopeptide (TPR) repeat protein